MHPVEIAMSRRRLLQLGGGAALSIALTSCGKSSITGAGGGTGASGSINWGTNEAFGRPNMIQPFTDDTGTKVVVEVGDSTEFIAKLRTGGSGLAGYTDGSYTMQNSFESGLLQPIDLSKIPNYKTNLIADFATAGAHEFDGQVYGIPADWGTDSVAYNHDKVSGSIDDIAALWDPQFKGRIAMPSQLHESVIVAAIYAGVDDPFTMDDDELAAVQDLLLKQKPLVRTYWSKIGDLTNLFASGEVDIAWAWIPVLELREKADMDIRWSVPKQGQLGWYDANVMAKDIDPEAKEAYEAFLNWTLGDSYGVSLADEAGYRTTSTAAAAKLPEDTRKELNLDDPSAFLNNTTFWIAPDRPDKYEAVMSTVLNA